MFLTNTRCDPRNLSVLSRSCSSNLEHLTPFLPARGVLFPSHYRTLYSTTCGYRHCSFQFHDTITKHAAKYLEAALIFTGDFNKANLTQVFFIRVMECFDRLIKVHQLITTWNTGPPLVRLSSRQMTQYHIFHSTRSYQDRQGEPCPFAVH